MFFQLDFCLISQRAASHCSDSAVVWEYVQRGRMWIKEELFIYLFIYFFVIVKGAKDILPAHNGGVIAFSAAQKPALRLAFLL